MKPLIAIGLAIPCLFLSLLGPTYPDGLEFVKPTAITQVNPMNITSVEMDDGYGHLIEYDLSIEYLVDNTEYTTRMAGKCHPGDRKCFDAWSKLVFGNGGIYLAKHSPQSLYLVQPVSPQVSNIVAAIMFVFLLITAVLLIIACLPIVWWILMVCFGE